MTDELRDQIAEAIADTNLHDAVDLEYEVDRVLAVVEPKLSEAMAEAEQLRGDKAKLTATIRAFPDANNAANIAHARMQRDTYVQRAQRAEAAIEQATVALTNALLEWQPEHEYRLERARRKGYSHDEVAVGVLGEAIKVASGVLAALNPAGGSETHIPIPGISECDADCPCRQIGPAGGSEKKEDPNLFCRCGHATDDHDAGECWARVDADGSQCRCSWYEPAPPDPGPDPYGEPAITTVHLPEDR